MSSYRHTHTQISFVLLLSCFILEEIFQCKEIFSSDREKLNGYWRYIEGDHLSLRGERVQDFLVRFLTWNWQNAIFFAKFQSFFTILFSIDEAAIFLHSLREKFYIFCFFVKRNLSLKMFLNKKDFIYIYIRVWLLVVSKMLMI